LLNCCFRRYCEHNPDGGFARCAEPQELSDDEIDRRLEAAAAVAAAAAVTVLPPPSRRRHLRRGVSDAMDVTPVETKVEVEAAVTVLPPPAAVEQAAGVADAMDVTPAESTPRVEVPPVAPVETKVEVEAPAAVEQAAAEAALSSAGTLRSPPPPLAAPSQLTPSLTPLSSPVALPPPSPSMETAAQSLQWIRQAAPSVRTVQPSAAKPRRQTVSSSRYWSRCAACKRMRNVPKSVHDEVRI
jgi:hypothetical protein